jgi:anti-sigma B factor antagonist
MEISERIVGGVVVLDLSGKLLGGTALKDKVNSLLHQGHKQLVIHMADVPYIDSAGLGDLVTTHATASRHGAALKLAAITKRNHDLLSITRMLTVFETYDTADEACASFTSV